MDDPAYFEAELRYLELTRQSIRYDTYQQAVAAGQNAGEALRCDPLTEEETAEKIRLRKFTVDHRRQRLIASGLPERFITVDGYAQVGNDVCREPGCWQPVGDDEEYVVQWSTRGGGIRWHQRHAPVTVLLSLPGQHQPRVIGNTGVAPAYPWPDDVFLQGGGHGVVYGRDGAYTTAFVEAAPRNPDTFLRGEGPTVADAETAAWETYQRYVNCETAPEHGPWERRGYTNGAGFCGNCGMFSSRRFDPEPYAEPSRLDRVFLGVDSAVDLIAETLAVDPKIGTTDE